MGKWFGEKWLYLEIMKLEIFEMAKSKKTRVKIYEIKDFEYKGNCGKISEPLSPPNLELYRKWRDIQRNQLGLSANIYMVFASAILGSAMNFMISNRGKCEQFLITTFAILSISIAFLFASLIFYGWFTHNRLNDFRETARLTKEGYTEDQISDKTADLGERTWNLYHFQRYALLIGFLISLIGFSIYIYS